MHVLVLTGSPRKTGNSNRLAMEFCRGAVEAGHQVLHFDLAHMDLHPCLACDHCRRTGGCVQQDDMQLILPHVVKADRIVLATPLYYFGFSAQIKMAVDRFYGVNQAMRDHPKQGILLAACGDEERSTMDALQAHFQALCTYCHWQNAGQILATGVYQAGDIEGTAYLDAAFQLGKSLA